MAINYINSKITLEINSTMLTTANASNHHQTKTGQHNQYNNIILTMNKKIANWKEKFTKKREKNPFMKFWLFISSSEKKSAEKKVAKQISKGKSKVFI